MDLVQTIVCIALRLYWLVLIVRIVFSWIPAPPDPVRPIARTVRALTDPLIVPLRGVIPPLQLGAVALDMSILIVFFGLWIVTGLLC
jgi:YggT family protein